MCGYYANVCFVCLCSMYVDTSGQMCMGNSIIVVNHLSVKESKYGVSAWLGASLVAGCNVFMSVHVIVCVLCCRFDVDKYLARCASRDIDTIGVFHTGDIEFNQKYTYYSKVRFCGLLSLVVVGALFCDGALHWLLCRSSLCTATTTQTRPLSNACGFPWRMCACCHWAPSFWKRLASITFIR